MGLNIIIRFKEKKIHFNPGYHIILRKVKWKLWENSRIFRKHFLPATGCLTQQIEITSMYFPYGKI